MLVQEVNSYISGDLKLILLISEWMIVFFAFEFSLIFFLRTINKKKNELKSLQEKAYVWLFLGYSISYVFYIIGDYYVNVSMRLIFYYLAYFILSFGAFSFIKSIEKYKIFIKKYFFSTLFLSLIIIFLIILFIANEYARIYSTVFYPTFGIFFLFYLRALYKDYYKKKELKQFRFNILKIIIGFILLALGYNIATDVVVKNFGLECRLIGNFIQIIAFLFIFLFFISIRSFSELDWQNKLNSIMIIHKSGLLIFNKNYKENLEDNDGTIVSGSVALLKIIIEDLTQNKENKETLFIEKIGKILIIQPGKEVIGALICDEKLDSLIILLKKVIEKIEIVYSAVLKDWQGDLKAFSPIKNIIEEIFY